MDHKFKRQGHQLSAGMYLACGVMIAPIAIGMLLSYPDPIWWLGILLCISSALLVFSGIQTFIKIKKETTRASDFRKDLTDEAERIFQENTVSTSTKVSKIASEKPSEKKSPVVVANWKFSKTEWGEFYKVELKTVRFNSLAVSVLLAGAGTFILSYDKSAHLGIAFTVSLSFGIIYFLGKNYMHKKTIEGKTNGETSVIIGLDTIMINEKLILLQDENRWLGKVELDQKRIPSVLEFTYHWQTRKGPTQDEIRIPVPKNKIKEAINVITKIREYHRI